MTGSGRLHSLGHDRAVASAAEALSVAAARIAALHPRVSAEELLARATSPSLFHATLRGRLLLMEIACPGLELAHAFYLLGTAADVLWHGAPVRLFLFGLYRPGELRSYLAASTRLYRDKLTVEQIRSWLGGESWPVRAAIGHSSP